MRVVIELNEDELGYIKSFNDRREDLGYISSRMAFNTIFVKVADEVRDNNAK